MGRAPGLAPSPMLPRDIAEPIAWAFIVVELVTIPVAWWAAGSKLERGRFTPRNAFFTTIHSLLVVWVLFTLVQ